MSKYRNLMGSGALLAVLVLAWGCADRTLTSSSAEMPATTVSAQTPPSLTVNPGQSTTVTSGTEHGHKSGLHGGIMISLGRDSYHAEAVFEKGGTLRLYTLGKDESRVIDVEKQRLSGFVKVDGENEAHPFSLEAQPQDGDTKDRTSLFIGTLPKGLWGQNLEVTVPNIMISGERFRLGFKSTPEEHDEGMPNKVADDDERQLYLTPGGKYTEADIKANGNVTATSKFKGLKSSHDMFPKPGDKICPVTKTKANPTFSWVVDGKTYEFCCPPCVDEFVKSAKATPDEIKPPADYVKRQ